MTVHLAKCGPAQLIHEVGWAPGGRTFCKGVTRDTYLSDLAYAEDLSFPHYVWSGEDREGKALTVSWLLSPTGHLMAAYMILGA